MLAPGDMSQDRGFHRVVDFIVATYALLLAWFLHSTTEPDNDE
jgi:hypothetical protein